MVSMSICLISSGHCLQSNINVLSASVAALTSGQLYALGVFISGLDLKQLYGDYRRNMMKYSG